MDGNIKKPLLISGIILLIACVIAVAAGVFYVMMYRRTLDASARYYARMHGRIVISFAAGLILAALGTLCLAGYFKT